MNIKIRRFIFRLICAVYPRFPVQRALWMVKIYGDEGLSQRRQAMLEADSQEMLRQGRQLDALRILHCAIILSPNNYNADKLARDIIASRRKAKSTLDRSANKDDYIHHQIDLEMQRFALYVMRAVERGGYAKLSPPKI